MGPELCVGFNSSVFKVQDLEGNVFALVLMLFLFVPNNSFAFSPFLLSFGLVFVRLF